MQSLLQTDEWSDFKAQFDWFNFKVNGLQVLGRKLPLGQCFFYIPEVYFSDWDSGLSDLKGALEPFVKQYRPIFLRLETLEKDSGALEAIFRQKGFLPSFEEVQPKYRQWVFLTKDIEDLLREMKPKGRYNIRLAQKKGVEVEIHDSLPGVVKDVDIFYSLMTETAKRDGFSIRPKGYFLQLFSTLYEKRLGKLYLAKYQDRYIAAHLITFYEEIVSYLYGSSSNHDREVMAPYLLHWQAMQDAKETGCKIYDFLAIAPPGLESHKHSQLSRFKKQFGGESVALSGGWDLIFRPSWYRLFSIVEKRRRA